MKIAISTEDKNGLESLVSHHFGGCPCYVFVEVEDQEVQSVAALDNPFAQSHQPGMVPEYIHNQGVDVMLSGGMGRRAIQFFDQFGIQARTGATGTVRSAMESFFGGKLSIAEPCRESLEHHKQGHH